MAASEQNMFTTTATTDYGYYDDDYLDEVCNKTKVAQFGAIFTPVFFSIVVILSLFGNILVMVILARYENLKSLTNAFILNLAVSDLIFTVGLPFWAYYHMYGWTLGEPACKIVSFVFYVGFYSSGILLIMMTVHRYVAVIRPLSDFVSPRGFYSILASVAIWAVSAIAATPAFIFSKVLDQHYCGYENSYGKLWGIYQQNILFVVTSLVFIFCYSQILCRLLRPTAQRRKHKTLKLIFTLVLVFFLGWAPYNIVIFLMSLSFQPPPPADSSALPAYCETYSKPLDYAFYISRLFAFSHCCLNPVFYVFVGVKFKNHLKRMLKGWSQSSNSLRSRNSRLTITSVASGEEFSM
uniref:chemokine XC receptor 1 n=1 Tax=Centroberyx gerrardi TaxID=166262 RepID=UPI003AB0FED4